MQIKNTGDIRSLCVAIAKMQTPEEVALLLEDLCTIQEMVSLSQRLQVATLLHNGRNYAEITKETGVSSATISRVNRCLNYGPGGYKLALELMKEDSDDNQ